MGSHLITVKQTQMILINTTMVVPQHKFLQNKTEGLKLHIARNVFESLGGRWC